MKEGGCEWKRERERDRHGENERSREREWKSDTGVPLALGILVLGAQS